MKEVISSPLDDINHIVCIPYTYVDTSHMTLETAFFWKNILSMHRIFVWPRIPKRTYYDSLCTRLYIDCENKEVSGRFFLMWKKVWEKRNIVIIEGAYSRLGVGNDLFDNASSIRRILVPPANAFEVYSEIYSAALEYCKKDDCILLAMGPAATVMSFELAKAGYWAIDIGHIDVEYMWYKMGAKRKTPLPGRYVNESLRQGDLTVNNSEYENSICLYEQFSGFYNHPCVQHC